MLHRKTVLQQFVRITVRRMIRRTPSFEGVEEEEEGGGKHLDSTCVGGSVRPVPEPEDFVREVVHRLQAVEKKLELA